MDDHALVTIENNLEQPAELTIVPYEVDPTNGFRRKETVLAIRADSLSFPLGPQIRPSPFQLVYPHWSEKPKTSPRDI